jgi:hypothetical protein
MLLKVRAQLESYASCIRSTLNLATQPEFDQALTDFPDTVTKYLSTICTSADPLERFRTLDKLRDLMRKEYRTEQTYESLRDEARKLGITKYSRLDKDGLRSAIEAHKQNGVNSRNIGSSVRHQNVAAESGNDAGINRVQAEKTGGS